MTATYAPNKSNRFYTQPMTARQIYSEAFRLSRMEHKLLSMCNKDDFHECSVRVSELHRMSSRDRIAWKAEQTRCHRSYIAITWVGAKRHTTGENEGGEYFFESPSGKRYFLRDFVGKCPLGYRCQAVGWDHLSNYPPQRLKRFYERAASAVPAYNWQEMTEQYDAIFA